MKNIVVGIDFSKNSENALRHGVAVVLKTNAKLHIVWVKNPASGEKLGATDDNHMLELAQAKLAELEKISRTEAPGHEINSVILEGKPYLKIAQYAENLPESLLIVGSHGASGFEEMFVGSNTMKIVGLSKVPVLIIGSHVQINRDLTKVLLPIDTSFETLQKVKFSCEIAKAFSARVSLLGICMPCTSETRHIINVQLNNAANICDGMNVRYSASTIDVRGSFADSVVTWAKNEDVNLIAIMREEEDDITSFWLASNTRQLMNFAPMPLLVIPNVNHAPVR